MSTTGRGDLRFVRYGSRAGYWNSIRPPGTVGLVAVPEHPGYWAGDDGNIYTTWGRGGGPKEPDGLPPRKKMPWFHNGYGYVSLWVKGRQVQRTIHRLVCRAFHGEPPAGTEASHLDGCRSNCCPSNLTWESPKSNHARKHEHGTAQRGERAGGAKLTDEAVLAIRARFEAGRSQKSLADEYGVGFTNIHKIVHRQTWRHI